MFNYEIGGNEKKIDTSEAFADIAHNKTLFIQKLTDNEPIKPEKVEGLRTVEDVFDYYKPKVDVSFERQDGSVKSETLSFSNLGDFSVKNIVNQSEHLSNVNLEKEMSLNVIKQLKSNKTLKSTLDNEETKEAFISALKNFVAELEQNK
ncbi:hypothetical protein C7T94_12950 [Pedobacter yulinensis]|uniref:Type VI secretion system contractile sheath small subunit n=1 Tax=Pedobacter yulinensis TaxID=2126353 RepID=A0A2T3HLZ8_9SPHI|nr:hypothetical protein [Pedobacter yulinensis]PST83465.1 hypothetical protein C7T94_12950 [Pedobacter yulinensis]